jgi:hypothetical protein
MELNLPISDQLNKCRNILIAGMGGGFDVFCGLPIYFELEQRGKNVHLANFSFTDEILFRGGKALTETLVGVTAEYKGMVPYFPELYLARWFKEKRNSETIIWSFLKTGAQPLLDSYQVLVEHLSIDGILLVDGGVDSLVRGDEPAIGTVIEDATSLFAVNELKQVPTKLLACIGFGAERDMAYASILENIAFVTEKNGFLGSCALIPQMDVYKAYEDAVLHVQSNELQDPSVINSSIVSAVQGHYGDFHLTNKTRGSRLWISPLMSLYWFFDLSIVAKQNLFLHQLKGTNTFRDAFQAYVQGAKHIKKREPERFPLL